MNRPVARYLRAQRAALLRPLGAIDRLSFNLSLPVALMKRNSLVNVRSRKFLSKIKTNIVPLTTRRTGELHVFNASNIRANIGLK